jgi:hypothetical protein
MQCNPIVRYFRARGRLSREWVNFSQAFREREVREGGRLSRGWLKKEPKVRAWRVEGAEKIGRLNDLPNSSSFKQVYWFPSYN